MKSFLVLTKSVYCFTEYNQSIFNVSFFYLNLTNITNLSDFLAAPFFNKVGDNIIKSQEK